MRVKNAEQCLGDLRKFVVDFEMDTRREERECFQQSFYMRIVALVGLQDEAPCDFRIFLTELRAKLAEIIEFALVIEEQFVTHRKPRAARPLTLTSNLILAAGQLKLPVERDVLRRRVHIERAFNLKPQRARADAASFDQRNADVAQTRLE